MEIESILKWFPVVNTLLIPLVGLAAHRLGRIERRLARHDLLLAQMKTVCQLRHPDDVAPPPIEIEKE